jgi:hypothetical protein
LFFNNRRKTSGRSTRFIIKAFYDKKKEDQDQEGRRQETKKSKPVPASSRRIPLMLSK